MANALLTFPGALGYVTELLSGELQRALRTLVAPPGVVGSDGGDAARRAACSASRSGDAGQPLALRAAAARGLGPRVGAARWRSGPSRVDLALERAAGRMTIDATAVGGPMPALALAPALPLDARVQSVQVDGADTRFRARPDGDVQRIEVDVPAGASAPRRIVFAYDEGTDVFTRIELPEPAASAKGCAFCARAWRTGPCAWSSKGAPAVPIAPACARLVACPRSPA